MPRGSTGARAPTRRWPIGCGRRSAKGARDARTRVALGRHELLRQARPPRTSAVPLRLPERPSALTAAERDAATRMPGLARALHLIAIDLRSEGVREWNFTLRGMDDRQLLAAAQLACDRQVWDRCINTSDRTRGEVDVAQRFPTPFRDAVVAQSKRTGVDPAYVYGLIRQESRFITDARSHAGASGLMQIMPATARWAARRLGVPYGPGMINDRDTNLRLGTGYLKLLLDDFEGSQALAAAAYNAGPGRPRRWRNGPELEPAIWAETDPFTETRDYVKKVLSNAAYYGAILARRPRSRCVPGSAVRSARGSLRPRRRTSSCLERCIRPGRQRRRAHEHITTRPFRRAPSGP